MYVPKSSERGRKTQRKIWIYLHFCHLIYLPFLLLFFFLSFKKKFWPWCVTCGIFSPTRDWGFPGGSVVKNLPANSGDASLISEWGRSPGEGNGNPVQYSFLENSMYRGAWQATVHGVEKSQTWFSNENNNKTRDGAWVMMVKGPNPNH